MKKLLLILGALLLPAMAFAAQVSVPSAPGLGFYLVSTTTGNYMASSTNTFNIGSLFASSTTATSTFAAGVVASALAITGASTGCAQFYAGGQLLSTGVNCGTGSGGTQAVSTSTAETANQLAYWTTTSGSPARLTGTATTSVTCTGGTTCTTFVTIGGTPITINSSVGGGTGLSSTTPWTAGQITYVVNNSTISSAATSSLTASGVVSLSNPISVIGASASAITITGGSNGQMLAWLSGIPTWTATTSTAAGTGITIAVNGAVTTVTNTGVTSLGNGTGITCTGTAPGSCSLASMSAGVLGTPITGIPSSQATSTLYGVGTGGMVLGYSGGNLVPLATTTFTGSGPISLSYASGQVTGSCATCNTSNATVSSIIAGLGLSGGTITTTGRIDLLSYLATSTGETQGQLAYWSTTSGTPAKLTSVATTTVTCGAGLTCTTFTTIGSSPITLTATAGASGGTWSTTTSSVVGNLINYPNNNTDVVTVGGNATTTAKVSIDPNVCLDNPCFGIGTSSPWGLFSWGAHNLSPTKPIFVIASSSTGVATSTEFIDLNGNIGIGTSSPATLFSINGIANFRAATTSFSSTGGIDLLSGCFAVRGVCVSGSGGGSGTVTQIIAGIGLSGGTITTSGRVDLLSYLATSTNETAGNLAYWSTTSGTPAKLNTVATSSVSAGTGITFSGTPGALVGGTALTINTPWTIAGNNIFNNNNNGLGNVGIATNTPWASFSIGSHNLSPATPAFVIASSSTGVATSTSFISLNGFIGMGTTSPYAQFSLNAPASIGCASPYFAIGSSTGEVLKLCQSANASLLLGTTTPGPASTSATSTIYMQKLQWQGGDSAGVTRCTFVNAAGAMVVQAGPCL